MSLGRIGCATKAQQGSVTSMTVHSAPPPICQASPRWLLNRDDSFHHQWEAIKATMCQPGINLPPLQLEVVKLSKQLHAADDVSALYPSITNGLSGHWFPPYISQKRQHFTAVTPCHDEICATCHLSDAQCTEKSQVVCVLSKSESAWEGRIHWEKETVEERWEISVCLTTGLGGCVRGRWRREAAEVSDYHCTIAITQKVHSVEPSKGGFLLLQKAAL